MGLYTVAEGVETVGQMTRLRAAGCDRMQGYLFAHPRPAAEWTQLLGADRPWLGAAPPAPGLTCAAGDGAGLTERRFCVPRYTWSSDSKVEIHASSSVHPIHGDIPIRGEASVEVRDGQLDPSGATGYIEADVDSLKSGNKLEDFELRRRLEAKKFPTMRYEVRSVEGGPDRFKVNGALTFHGVTREFVEECGARLDGDGAIHIEAEHGFDIREFDVKPPKIGPLQVHPEVSINLHLVGRESASGWA